MKKIYDNNDFQIFVNAGGVSGVDMVLYKGEMLRMYATHTKTFTLTLSLTNNAEQVQLQIDSDNSGRAAIDMENVCKMVPNGYYEVKYAFVDVDNVTDNVTLDAFVVEGKSPNALRYLLPRQWCRGTFYPPVQYYALQSMVAPFSTIALPCPDWSAIKVSTNGVTYTDITNGMVSTTAAKLYIKDSYIGEVQLAQAIPLPVMSSNRRLGYLEVTTSLYFYDITAEGNLDAVDICTPLVLKTGCEVVEVKTDGANTELMPLFAEFESKRSQKMTITCRLPKLNAYSYAYYALLLQLAESVKFTPFTVLEGWTADVVETAAMIDTKSVKWALSPFTGLQDLTFNLIVRNYAVY